MLNRIKRILTQCMSVVAVIVAVAAAGGYVLVNAALVAQVGNELRMDTYLDLQAGIGIVMLMFFMVYVPLWFLVRHSKR